MIWLLLVIFHKKPSPLIYYSVIFNNIPEMYINLSIWIDKWSQIFYDRKCVWLGWWFDSDDWHFQLDYEADTSPYAEQVKFKLKEWDEIEAVYRKILYGQSCIDISNNFNFSNFICVYHAK